MDVIGTSASIQSIRVLIQQVAETEASVLITGESGTGKEMVAKAIHAASKRKQGAFIPVNCGAIPGELLESELFGHEKGAFTGAISARAGRFELANQGTLFLDEIGDMPILMQVKLLRVLQEYQFERVGGVKSIQTDVRVIAATHQELEQQIHGGQFRHDLYYRLNVFPIHIPPLRERLEDIPVLLDHFLKTLSSSNKIIKGFDDEAFQYLLKYQWPGNVRELANIIERLCILYPGQCITSPQLPDKLRQQSQESHLRNHHFDETILIGQAALKEGFDLKEHLEALEQSLIARALSESNQIVSQAAKKLGIRRTTLVEKMRKYSIQKMK